MLFPSAPPARARLRPANWRPSCAVMPPAPASRSKPSRPPPSPAGFPIPPRPRPRSCAARFTWRARPGGPCWIFGAPHDPALGPHRDRHRRGGTNTKIAVANSEGKILRELEIPTEPSLGPARFVRRVVSVIHLWESELDLEHSRWGLGLAGDVDSKGTMRAAPSLPGWSGFNFRRALSSALKRPVVIDNDANMAAWGGYGGTGPPPVNGRGGHFRHRGRRRSDHQRQALPGATGSAGGDRPLPRRTAGLGLPLRRAGCLEAYAGAYGLSRMAKALLAGKPRKPSKLRRLSPAELTPRVLAEAAEAGDAVAREVWRRAAAALAAGLAGIVLILNPEMVLILGGVSRAGKLCWTLCRRPSAASPSAPLPGGLLRAARNPNLGCVGAALLALEESAPARN